MGDWLPLGVHTSEVRRAPGQTPIGAQPAQGWGRTPEVPLVKSDSVPTNSSGELSGNRCAFEVDCTRVVCDDLPF